MKMNITKKRGKKREKREKKQMGIHTRKVRSEKPGQKNNSPRKQAELQNEEILMRR
jgi:hypothetical protein